MLPITKNIPKEMLPVSRKPMLQYVIEEAVTSGFTQICIVIRAGKEIIRDYFSLQSPYPKQSQYIDELEHLINSCRLTFVYQPQPLGLGHAMLQARGFVGNDPFVVLIPDQLFYAAVPASQQILQQWQPGKAIWNSLIKIPKKELHYFAGARGLVYNQRLEQNNKVTIRRIATESEIKQKFAGLDYEIRGFGRTIYPAAIFDYLGPKFVNPHTNEVDLLKTFKKCAAEMDLYGVLLKGTPLDMGAFPSYYYYLSRWQELSQ